MKSQHHPSSTVTSSASSPSPPSKLANQPALIQFKHLKFLVFDAPSDRNIELYTRELLSHRVTDVVRVCDPTYDKSVFEAAGIKVHDWPFPDGEAPPNDIVSSWLNLVGQRFGSPSKESEKANAAGGASDGICIGVHCVAGLGRAPVLVAMALIEAGMSPLDSVIFIRERRRGAINARQLKYLEAYKRRSKDKSCVIQ